MHNRFACYPASSLFLQPHIQKMILARFEQTNREALRIPKGSLNVMLRLTVAE
jgi:hypothetical protein